MRVSDALALKVGASVSMTIPGLFLVTIAISSVPVR